MGITGPGTDSLFCTWGHTHALIPHICTCHLGFAYLCRVEIKNIFYVNIQIFFLIKTNFFVYHTKCHVDVAYTTCLMTTMKKMVTKTSYNNYNNENDNGDNNDNGNEFQDQESERQGLGLKAQTVS